MRRYVLGFCFDLDYRDVLLIQKLRPAWQAGRLNGLGGKIEDGAGEGALAAMRREFREETGGVLDEQLAWRPFGRLVSGDDWEVWLFHAHLEQSFPAILHGQTCDEGTLFVVAWDMMLGLPVLPNLKYLIPMAKNHLLGHDKAPFFEIVESEIPAMFEKRGS